MNGRMVLPAQGGAAMSATATDLLSPEDVFIDVAAPDKRRLLEVLSRRAAARLGLNEDNVVREVLNREALGSTGVGKGVALPHARLAELKRPFAMLARLRNSMEFEAIDGEPVDLVVLLLMPHDQAAGHVSVLASIARKLRSEDVRSRLRKAGAVTDLYEAFRRD
jgi:PTS system nitrogen regulatory IIA component